MRLPPRHAIIPPMLIPQPQDEDFPAEPPDVKAARRAMIAEATERFLSNGGKIKQVATGVSGEKEQTGMKRMIFGEGREILP